MVAAIASAAVLLVLAIPALSLEFGDGALRQFPEGNETRVGAELAAKQAGPGAAGPTQVAAFETARADPPTAPPRSSREAGARPRGGRRSRRPAALATTAARRCSRSAPRHDPESPQARAMVDRLRAADPGRA